MNREIKFRAWDKFQNKYVFVGFHILGEVSCFGGIESVIGETWKERSEKLKYNSSLEAWDDFVFEQYTGMKDNQGKDIYEGDIVKRLHTKSMANLNYEIIEVEEISFIEYRNNGFWVESESFGYEGEGLWNWEEMEVIGNIFQNKELLTNKITT